MRPAIAVAWAVLAACHGAAAPVPPAPPGCKAREPVCDPAVPEAAALAIVGTRCAACHADGGRAAHPLIAAPGLRAERGNVALRVAGCEMPPEGPPLPDAERSRLIGWAACLPLDSAALAGTKSPADR